MKYYIGIAIQKSGHAAVTKPYSDFDLMMEELKGYVATHFDKVKLTTYITRASDKELTLADVFGDSKTRDLMRDKKFIKEITQ